MKPKEANKTSLGNSMLNECFRNKLNYGGYLL